MIDSPEFQRHRALHSRCQHPQGEHVALTRAETSRSIPARFDMIASMFPQRPAVVAKAGVASYQALSARTNRLAHAIIRTCGHGAEPVGVLASHGVDAVAATLAVLKAGKFYVPLDPSYPVDRLAYMLGDTNAGMIITDAPSQPIAEQLARGRTPILQADEALDDEGACDGPALSISSNDVAGIYYTSGSTGRPKGIIYTHLYVLHNMMNYGQTFHVSPHDRWTWLHSLGFSPALTDIFCPLFHGAALCPWDLKRDGFDGLGRWLDETGVTIFHWMATPFRTFASTLSRSQQFANVRLTIFGGEKLYTRDVSTFSEFFPSECLFAHRLGASEAGLYQVYIFDKHTPLDDAVVPAGYAVPDKTAVILDDNGAELPVGEIGEIGVRSRYLPPGYWGQPELTRTKYLDSKNGGEERTYLTGDLGRMRPDGCLDYCGRNDAQVKIRGQRVEIGEVESALRQLDGVGEAVVTTCESQTGDRMLAGYVVPRSGASFTESVVRQRLGEKLPNFMVPAALVLLDALPVNSNGKIDLAALPTPNLSAGLPSENYAVPQTLLQCHLVELWQEILQARPIGIDDDFFSLGGDSLLGMRIVANLQPLLASTLYVPPLFEHSTIRSFAEFLESRFGEEVGPGKLPVVKGQIVALQDELAKQAGVS